MRWRKRDLWQAGVVITSMLLLLMLMLMAWIPVLAAGTYEGASGSATSGTVTAQATPTEDATVTALNKEKLAQEVQQLKEQNAPDLFGWLRTNAAILFSTLVVVIGGLIGLFRWFADRQNEREKRAEERFQFAVTGLGDEKEGARIGAAILLRTFLRPGYEQFYIQTFDLVVAHLRLPRSSDPPVDPNTPLPLTTLTQALIVVFTEAFPLAKIQNKGDPRSLDATGIQLDNAYLVKANLQQIRLLQASLRQINFSSANLSRANFRDADLRSARLVDADLRDAKLAGTDLRGADLRRVRLEGANLCGVKGLTKEQLEACKAKGATVDEDSTTSSSQSTVAPASPSPSNDEQASSALSALKSTPPPDTGGSSVSSSIPDAKP